MKTSTFVKIKKELRKLADIYEILVENWNGPLEHGNRATFPITVTVNVLLQNLAFHSPESYGYDQEKEEKKLWDGLKVLEKLNEYNDYCYMTHFPFTEADSIITGSYQAEAEE